MAWQTPFSEQEDQFIRKNYPEKGPTEIAYLLGRSRSGVSHRITTLGLREEECTTRACVVHGEQTRKTRPETLLEVSSKGDEQKTLEALRDVLAARIDATDSPRDTAALAKRMVEVGKRIAELRSVDAAEKAKQRVEVTSFDVIAGRYAERRAAAQA